MVEEVETRQHWQRLAQRELEMFQGENSTGIYDKVKEFWQRYWAERRDELNKKIKCVYAC